MKLTRKSALFSALVAFIPAAACALLVYCEKLQFIPVHSKTFIGLMGIALIAAWLLSMFAVWMIQKAFEKSSSSDLIGILLISLVLSVCLMVWFPVLESGIYSTHTLEITALPDADGSSVRPVTLTWLHTDQGDVSLTDIACEGSCVSSEIGPGLTGADGVLLWRGKTGDSVTLEFASGTEQGIAEVRWDGNAAVYALNNPGFERLSFDHTFPPSNGLPEFIAAWVVSLTLSLTGISVFVKLLPLWTFKKFACCAFLCFALFRVFVFRTVQEPLFFIDSESYLGMSRMSVSEIIRGTEYCHDQFWYCIARPAFIPLVYKACRQDPSVICIVQLAVSVLCWGYFAVSCSKLCEKDSRKKAVLILTLGLGCVPNITRWDNIIMSESLSISAALLLMGSCFRLTAPDKEQRWKPLWAVFTALSALLYAQSRDSGVWIVILIMILLLAINRLRSGRIVVFLTCGALLLVSWFSISNTGGRWQYPFENVLFNRILRDPQGESFFIDAGMPTPSGITELYGQEHMMGSEVFNSAEMAPLREWIQTEGLKTYIHYLLRTPFQTLRMTWYEGFEKEAFEQIGYIFAPAGFKQILPDAAAKFFSANLPGILVIGIGLFAVFATFHVPNGETLSFPVLFILSAYPLCCAAYIADEYELARHSMVIILMMKASFWPLLCVLSEKLPLRKNN